MSNQVFTIKRAEFLLLTAALSGASAAACGINYASQAADAGASDAGNDRGSASSSGGSHEHDGSSTSSSSSSGGTGSSGGSGSGSSSGCPAGQTECGSTCVDTSTDPQNCGSCTNACMVGGHCWSSQCCYPATEGGAFGGGVCIVYPECGCSPNQNCERVSGGPEQCVPDGSKPPLGNCTTSADCQHSLACADGVCDPLCGTCGTNYACLLQYFGTTYLGYSVCEPHCNPVYPSVADSTHVACGSGQRCQMSYNSQGSTYCEYPSGTLGQGAACTYPTQCLPGYECVNVNGAGTYKCEQYCRVGFSDCLTGTCTPYQTAQYDNTTQIGVCQ